VAQTATKLWVGSGNQGPLVRALGAELGSNIEVVCRPSEGTAWRWNIDYIDRVVRPRAFHVVRRRWVVERTFAWLGRNRRLAKNYEQLPSVSEALIMLAMTPLMARRLAAASGLQEARSANARTHADGVRSAFIGDARFDYQAP
jgi:transposase